jgi:hypothetical protein
MPGIERRQQTLDGPALARRVPALEHHTHGRAEPSAGQLPAVDEPQLQQPVLPLGQALLLLLLGQPEAQVDIIQLGHGHH